MMEVGKAWGEGTFARPRGNDKDAPFAAAHEQRSSGRVRAIADAADYRAISSKW